jgi:8-oxo-dGTP diphosphatase
VLPSAEIEELVWISPGDVSLPLAPLTRDHLLPIARQRLAGAGR